MLRVNSIIQVFFYLLLLNPVLNYIFINIFHVPNKSIYHLYVFVVFIFGLLYVSSSKIRNFSLYLWLLLGYAFYRASLYLFVDYDIHILTKIHNLILYFTTFFIVYFIHITSLTNTFIANSIKLIKFTVIIVAAVSCIQFYIPSFLNAFGHWNYDSFVEAIIYVHRRTSIFGFINLNELGISFLPLCSVFIGWLLYKKDKSLIIFLLMIGIISILSNIRYVMFSFLLICLQVIFAHKNKIIGSIHYILASCLISIILFFTLIHLGYNLENFYENRLFPEDSITQTTRYKALGTFSYFFPQNPIFGNGFFMAEEIREMSMIIAHSSQIHVGYLAHLVSYGIFGSFLWYGFLFLLLKKLYINAKLSRYWGSFFALIIYLWTQVTFVEHNIFFTGLIFALAFDKYIMDRNTNSIRNENVYLRDIECF